MSDPVRRKRVRRQTQAATPAATGRARVRRKTPGTVTKTDKPIDAEVTSSAPTTTRKRTRTGRRRRTAGRPAGPALRKFDELDHERDEALEFASAELEGKLKAQAALDNGNPVLEGGRPFIAGDDLGTAEEVLETIADEEGARDIPVTTKGAPTLEDDKQPGELEDIEPRLTPWGFKGRQPTPDELERRNAEIQAIVDYRDAKKALAEELDADANALTYIRPDMVGNRLWMLGLGQGGAPRVFETPDDMRAACASYFEWVEANPLFEHKVAQFQGEMVPMHSTKMRAMSKRALCLHLGIARPTWDAYRILEGYEELVRGVEDAIYSQKFEGAAADLLSAMVICRDLGLKDRSDITSGDEPVTGIIRTVIQDAAATK